jgi:hypothetical protein
MTTLVTSRDHFKGRDFKLFRLYAFDLSLSALSPRGSVFDDPIEESSLKANIVASLFAFDPLMA